jgi:hypothetical protein
VFKERNEDENSCTLAGIEYLFLKEGGFGAFSRGLIKVFAADQATLYEWEHVGKNAADQAGKDHHKENKHGIQDGQCRNISVKKNDGHKRNGREQNATPVVGNGIEATSLNEHGNNLTRDILFCFLDGGFDPL